MLRVIAFLLAVCLIAYGFAWLADMPGEVVVTWLGVRIETSVMVGIAAIAVLAVATALLWSALRFVLRWPFLARRAMRRRRRRRGYLAISRGLIAIGAGDSNAARRFAAEAARIAPNDPLALLLRAQTAQLTGDRAAAEQAFEAMAKRQDTKLIGLRGLFVEAQRRDDPTTARIAAEAAAKAAPALPWAGQAVLEFRCAARDWEGALAVLDEHLRNGLIGRPRYRRLRAVLLTAHAIAAEERDRDTVLPLALEATRLAPDLVPAAALAGRLLSDSGEIRRAGQIIVTAWRLNPHPDLAEIYAHLRIGDTARDRLARIRLLAQQSRGHIEGALALARAALDAREFATSRTALEPYLADPTLRVAVLMAEIEEIEHGDEGRAREWMARAVRAQRDPAWTADGYVSDRWMPVSPVTGRLDAFEWRVPLAEVARPVITEQSDRARTMIEAGKPPVSEGPPKPPVAEPMTGSPEQNSVSPQATEHSQGEPAEMEKSAADTLPAGEPVAAPVSTSPSPAPAAPVLRRGVPPSIAAVIPLVPVPDDPGPQPEPQPELITVPRTSGWRRFWSLFW